MTFVIMDAQLGCPPIGSALAASTAAGRSSPWKLGDIVKAVDPVYGVGEFIYLLGVANTVLGSVVTYDGASAGTPTYQTALAPSTAGLDEPLAVATGAITAGLGGWYQISGSAIVATNGTLAAGPGPVYLAGSGQVTSTQANGKQVMNARNETATGTPAANQAVVKINRPFAQGQIV